MNKMTIKERASRKMEDWKEDINQLEQQLEHSVEEAKMAFEKQNVNLATWIDKIKSDLEKLEDYSEDKAGDLKVKLEELRVQTALGKAEAADALHDRQKQLNHAMQNAKIAISRMRNTATEQSSAFLDKAHYALDNFHTSFDMFRLQMNLGKKESTQFWQEKRKDISNRVGKMKVKINQIQEKSADRWEHFSEEMSEAWSHIKDAVK